MDELSSEIFGLNLKNPIWLASSDATRIENMDKAIESGAGAIVMKSVTELSDFQKSSITRYMILDEKDNPVRGFNEGMYTFFSRGGPMQSINKVVHLMPQWKKKAQYYNTKLFGSVSAGSLQGWEDLSYKLAISGVDGIELNFGNPHAKFYDKDMGMKISNNEDLAVEVVKSVKRKIGNLPIIVKVSPEASNLGSLTQKILRYGADGVTATHRYQGLRFNIDTEKPFLDGSNGVGGSWMKPLTIHAISKLFQNIEHPIIGGNGVGKWQDVIEMILAGAQAVQLGTSIMINGYKIVDEFVLELKSYLRKHNYSSYRNLIGKGTTKLYDKGSVSFPKINLNIDNEICNKCINKPCKDSCYFGALSFDGEHPVINELCNGCGLCISSCPFDAIKITDKS